MSGEFKIQISGDASSLQAAGEQSAQTLGKVADKTQEAGEQAKTFNEHGREMHRLFGELDRIIPGVGEALHGALSPEALPILAVVVGVELFAKALSGAKDNANQLKESLDALASANINAWLDSINAAVEAQGKLTDAVNATKTAADELKKTFDGELESVRGQADQAQKLLDAKEKLALAEAGNDPIKQAQVKEQFGELKGDAARQARADALHLEYTNKLALESQRGILQTQLGDASRAQHNAGLLAESDPSLKAAKERLTKELVETENSHVGLFSGDDAGSQRLGKISGFKESLAQVQKQLSENEQRVKDANEAHERVNAALHANAEAIEGSNERLKGGGLQFVQWKKNEQETGDVDKIVYLLKEIRDTLQERGLLHQDVSGPGKQLDAIMDPHHTGAMDSFVNASAGAIHAVAQKLQALQDQLYTPNHGRSFPQ